MTSLFRDLHGAPRGPRGSVACIGAFDGLHLGHRALVRQAVARARELDADATVVSFDPLPREFFAKGDRPPRLMLPRAKIEGLRALGADVVGLLRFDAALAAMAAEAFVRELLIERLGVCEVWVGPGFRFGQGRRGDLALLQDIGVGAGFSAHEIAPVLLAGASALPVWVPKRTRPSGVVAATICPPPSPPSGPRSMTQSASAITSRSCSMTTTLWPPLTRRCNTRMSLSTSAMCRPTVGSSST